MFQKKKKQTVIPQSEIYKIYLQCQAIDSTDAEQAKRRGYLFQDLLYSILYHEQLQPRASYRPKGEEIDGSFYLSRRTYLLEAKWVKNPISASTVFSFKGKVDGKLSGTLGVFMSMSGFSEDAPGALERGKEANVLLFDQSDMNLIFEGKVSFTDMLDFKMRQAGETGKLYVPFKLPKAIQEVQSKKVISTTKPETALGFISSVKGIDIGFGKTFVLLMCEGQTDAIILEKLFGRLLATRYSPWDIALDIKIMGGMKGWVKRLPEIVNIKQTSLGGQLDGIIVLLDSDFRSDSELSNIKTSMLKSIDRLAISTPMYITFARPNIEGWLSLDKTKYKSSSELRLSIMNALEHIDYEQILTKNPEVAGIVDFLTSIIEEDEPLWESDAVEAVKTVLSEADWDDKAKRVLLYPRYNSGESAIICKSIEELKYELAEIASVGAMNSMPFESGEAVFEVDYDGIVDEILLDYYAGQIDDLGWEL